MPAPAQIQLQAARLALREKLARGDVGPGALAAVPCDQEIVEAARELLLVDQRRAARGLPPGDRA